MLTTRSVGNFFAVLNRENKVLDIHLFLKTAAVWPDHWSLTGGNGTCDIETFDWARSVGLDWTGLDWTGLDSAGVYAPLGC